MSGADIDRMTRDDLGLAIEWAANEGWNPPPPLVLDRSFGVTTLELG